MKILINTPDQSLRGGVSNYYTTLRPFLTDEVRYFTVGKRNSRSSFYLTILQNLKDYWYFIHTIKQNEFDLIILNPSLGRKAIIRDGIFLLIAKIMQKKVLVFIHGWNFVFENTIRKSLFVFKYIYFKANGFIVLAGHFKDVLQEWGYKGPVYVETTMIPFAVKRPVPDPADNSRPLNILVLTRIEKEKGVYESVKAYSLLKMKYPRITLIVAGTGTELDNLKGYVESRGIKDVHFTGWVNGNDKQSVFAKADIYLFSSYSEGMPTSVLEAMGYGLPVITSSVGGLKDFFEDGKMGYITESKDPQVYAGLIEKLIINTKLRAEIGDYNHKYAKETFLASGVSRRLEEIYSRVCNSSETRIN